MSKRTVIPFGPQHPVLPEPLHLDLVLDDEKVVEALPRIGYVHRGLEKLVEKRDYKMFVYVVERICGICSYGHSLGYAQCVEQLMGVQVPARAEYLRVIFHELSRVHNHLLWLGLLADGFGFESLFMHSWRLRERVLDIFEECTGGRVIFSANDVGGFRQDVDDATLKGMVVVLRRLEEEYRALYKTFLLDTSVKSRLDGVAHITKEQAAEYSMVGPFARASGLAVDERLHGVGAYGALAAFEPVLSDGGDCYARCVVRANELFQSIDIIAELVDKVPPGEVSVKVKGNPAAGARSMATIEQPRGQAFYYAAGNGTKFLERMRVRTPTAQNMQGLVASLAGCDLADVPMIILTIDPCISCTER